MQKKSIKEVNIHLLCWGILIFLEVIFVGLINHRFSAPLFYILFYPLNASLFYFHSLVVMRFIGSERKNIVLFIVFLALEICIYLSISVLFSYILGDRSNFSKQLTPAYFAGALWRGSWFIAYSTGYFYLKEYLKKQNRDSEKALEIFDLQNQLLLAEKEYLRAQLNPHLLFNTFNFIKYASKKNPQLASEAIQELSDIISYALYTGRKEFVPLIMEVEQVEKIINLNRLRFGQPLNLKFNKKIESDDVQIIPIILLTLVENIFKHGEIIDPELSSSIEITSTTQHTTFTTHNVCGNFPEEDGIKTGLENIRLRLKKSYPNQHEFHFDTDGKVFNTYLRIAH